LRRGLRHDAFAVTRNEVTCGEVTCDERKAPQDGIAIATFLPNVWPVTGSFVGLFQRRQFYRSIKFFAAATPAP
jgi:hypothetical protein